MITAGRRRICGLILGACLSAALVVGTALATANTLHLKIPLARVGSAYGITISGSTSGVEHLYLFIDSLRCGANPAVEHSRANKKTGTSHGYYTAAVNGSFSITKGFKTTARITDHACAYLTKASTRAYSRKGVLARVFKAYRVRS